MGEGTRIKKDAREARGTHRKATEKAGRGRPASRRQWEGKAEKGKAGKGNTTAGRHHPRLAGAISANNRAFFGQLISVGKT